MLKIDKKNIRGSLNGYIYNTSYQIEEKGLSVFKKLTFQKKIIQNHWELYCYKTNEPLLNEDERIIEKSNAEFIEYVYPIICCRANKRVILLSYSRKIINHLIERLNDIEQILFKNTFINVNQLVRHLFECPSNYIMTQINAKYSGHGESLDYVMLSGNNISEADLFIKYIDSFNVFRCGVRLNSSFEELLTLSNNGGISFKGDSKTFYLVDAFFTFLKDLNLLK